MLVKFILNGAERSFEAEADEPLSALLRRDGIKSVKDERTGGRCEFCTVLLDGKPVESCKIRSGILDAESEVETLESFRSSENFRHISKGFSRADFRPCSFCEASKFFLAHEILESSFSQEDIRRKARDMECGCTDTESLMAGIRNALSEMSGKGKK